MHDWWSVDDHSALFDPVASGLPLVNTSSSSNLPLLHDIYTDVRSGWVKIAVVRDPVTRLLSAYLDLARMREIHVVMKQRGELKQQGDAHKDRKGDENGERVHHFSRWSLFASKSTGGEDEEQEQDLEEGNEGGVELLETFEEFVKRLERSMSSAPSAFRPWSSLCGLKHAEFESIIPFETLQVLYCPVM